MIKYHNIGYDWTFIYVQDKDLEQYYDANNLLVDCLRTGVISRSVREEIEETILLPIAEIEKRKSQILD